MFQEDLLLYRLGLTSPVDLLDLLVTNKNVMGRKDKFVYCGVTISMFFWIYVVELISLPEKGSNVI